MGRQRNEQSVSDIRRAVWALFIEQGYTKTSFSAVAARAGVPKSIVQYYFGKKEDLASIIMKSVSAAVLEVIDTNFPTVDNLSRYYLAVQVYYYTFFHSLEMRQFNLDVLESRSLADASMHQQIDWAWVLIGGGEKVEPRAVSFELVEAWGGFTELLYHSLQFELTLDISRAVTRVVQVVAETAGYDTEKIAQVITNYQLTDEKLLGYRARVSDLINAI